MNYGLYLSAAGTLASLHRQDVLANNLANINTVGFKPDTVQLRSRLPERLEAGTALADPQLLLEQLGGGQYSNPTRVSLRQGDVIETENDFDLAIQGDGFFVIHNGSRGKDSIRFTRDGRLTLNPAGDLVLSATGMRVLDVNDQPIRLNRNAKVQINGDGQITQNNVPVAQIQVSSVADTSGFIKDGNNLLRVASAMKGGGKRLPASGMVKQGAIESSAVDPILALNSMINASKAVQANATMMQYHDNVIGQAINTMARVA
jgi:flagellar basal body rod protein FlgG